MRTKLLLFAAALVVVFALHHDYLFRGFYEDDYNFLASADQGFYSAQLTSWTDLAGFWNPQRGWFYRPVYLTYFALISLLFGPSPIILHTGGLILHAGVVAILGWLVWRLTRQLWLSAACAVAFLLWPGKAEAVWWIAAHSTLLAALFSLACLHCWLSWRQSVRRRYLWFALLCYWLALCSKNDAVSLPIAIFCLDAWYATTQGDAWRTWLRSWRGRLIELAPFTLAFILFVTLEMTAARFYALHGDTGVQHFAVASIATRVNTFSMLLKKLWLGILPLAPFGFGTVLSIGATVVIARRFARGLPLWPFLIWGFVAALPVPLLASFHALAERFSYIPALGVSCAFIMLLVAVGRGVLRERQFGGLHLLLLAIAIHPIGELPGIQLIDPVSVWIVLFLSLSLGFILWRAGVLSTTMAVLLASIAAGTQTAMLMPVDVPVYLWAVLLLGAILGWRTERALMAWCTTLFVFVAWGKPVVAVPLTIAAIVLVELNTRNRQAQPVQYSGEQHSVVGSLQHD